MGAPGDRDAVRAKAACWMPVGVAGWTAGLLATLAWRARRTRDTRRWSSPTLAPLRCRRSPATYHDYDGGAAWQTRRMRCCRPRATRSRRCPRRQRRLRLPGRRLLVPCRGCSTATTREAALAAGAAVRAERPARRLRALPRRPRRAPAPAATTLPFDAAQHPLPPPELLARPAAGPAGRPAGARAEPELDAGAADAVHARRLHRTCRATRSSASACTTASCWRCSSTTWCCG